MSAILQHLIIYWPLVIVFIATFLLNLMFWMLAVVVQNRRWKKAILSGKYVQDKTREQLQKQRLAIKWYERELRECRAQRSDAENKLLQVRAALERREE